MRWLYKIWFALRSIGNREKFESDLNDELTDFLERDSRNKQKLGLTREEAERAARLEMHGVHQTKERVRELRPGVWFEIFWQDIRFAARILWKRPAYLILAVATIALGIGANTAIFSLVNAVLLQPLPYQDAERLVLLQTQTRESLLPQVSYLDFLDVQSRHHGIEQATFFLHEDFVVEQQISGKVPQPTRKYGLRVTPTFFQTLRVYPKIGRSFTQNETISGDRVAIISHRLWKELFNEQENISGQQFVINEQSFTVLGVMPENFDIFLPMTDSFTIQDIDVYIPFAAPPEFMKHRSVFTCESIARLRKNVTQQQANADILQISRRLAQQYPDTNSNRSLIMTPLRQHVIGGARSALYLLMAAVVAVLLVACANLANLMIGRVTARDQELAVRTALGASRGRLIRQLAAESTLLVGIGGIAGILFAWRLLPQMTERLAARVPYAFAIGLNMPVLLFAVLACLITGIASGLIPAGKFVSKDTGSLPATNRASAGSKHARMRKGLVVTEIAISSVLLAGAILLGSSFLSLMHVSTGFDSKELLTFEIRLSESRYETRKQVANTLRELTDRISTLPGVKGATASSSLPLSGHSSGTAVWIEGRMPTPGMQPPESRWQFVQPNYFETMRIPLVQGRLFQARDLDHKTHVTLISESVAQRDFPNENPIGKRVSYGPPGQETDWHEIIGVVGDVRHETLRDLPMPRVYDLLGQHADLILFVVIRTNQNATQIVPSIRAIASQFDPGAPIYSVRTMEEWKARSANREQMLATIVGFFALAALFLGAVGAYGVISSLVAQRTREIGIRMALGASPRAILGSTVREGLELAITGLAIGTLACFALTPMLRGLLFGVKSGDPSTFISIVALLIIVALTACYIPARRAANVDPMRALRQE